MAPTSEIPIASSIPTNTEDAVHSALLRYADTYLNLQGKERIPLVVPTALQSALEHLLNILEHDAALKQTLNDLPATMGNGLLLQPIFARLFSNSPQPVVVTVPPLPIPPTLTQRQQEVMQQMAKGLSKEAIAAALHISAKTVKTHVDTIYAKLDVDNRQDALTKASSYGLLKFDYVDLLEPMRAKLELDYTPFTEMLLTGLAQDMATTAQQNVAALGLFLFVMAPLSLSLRIRQTQAVHYKDKGVLLECDRHARLNRVLSEGLNLPAALAFAPSAATRHGFREGHLYVADRFAVPDSLNIDALREFTPDGRLLRSFTGGAYLSTSINNCCGTVFTPDGRLLVTSGAGTNAILEFTSGGRTIRRLADEIPYGVLSTDRSGNLYLPGGSGRGSHICVYSSQGKLQRKVGSAPNFHYTNVAIDATGRLHVSRVYPGRIEVYETNGEPVGFYGEGILKHPLKIAFSADGTLYVLDDYRTVQILDPDRYASIRSFPTPPGVILYDFVFHPNGNLILAGFRE